MDDLLLLDADTANVVYSTKKRIDFGTNGFTGPYADDGLGEVLDDLTSVAVGDAVVSDTFFYIPTRGAPVIFLAAAIRSGPEVVGAVVTEVPVEVLSAVMTAEFDWQLLGLGDTGEATSWALTAPCVRSRGPGSRILRTTCGDMPNGMTTRMQPI